MVSLKIPSIATRLFWSILSYTWDVKISHESIEQCLHIVNSYSQIPGELLDLGCGTGQYSLSFAEKKWRVTGIDYSKKMLKHAKAKASVTDSKISFNWADLNKPLPFSSNTFDCVICISVLQCLLNPFDLFPEINRVLRSGGILFILVKSEPGKENFLDGATILSKLMLKIKSIVSSPRFLNSFQLSELTNALMTNQFVVQEAVEQKNWLRVVARILK